MHFKNNNLLEFNKNCADPVVNELHFEDFETKIMNWDAIAKNRRMFLEDEINSEGTLPIREEIYTSWQFCKRVGVNPYLDINETKRPPSEINALLTDNRFLIESLLQVIKNSILIASRAGNRITFLDKECNLLFNSSDRGFQPGVVMTEEKVGTSVHVLAIKQKSTYCMIGPENYNQMLADHTISEATPVYDENNELLGVITFICPLIGYDKLLNLVASHASWYGFTAALAKALENNYNFRKRYYAITTQYNALASIAETSDFGIMLIDNNRKVLHVNSVISKMLNMSSNIAANKYLEEIPGDFSEVSQIMERGIPVAGCKLKICLPNSKEISFVQVTPISSNNGENAGALLYLRNNISGSLAETSKAGVFSAEYTFQSIKGNSAALREAVEDARSIAEYDASILLEGESGCGKELFAQAIHNLRAKDKPFIPVNCAAIPQNLIESELFGYESGTFTGADKKGRKGKIELAADGTLFLDEVGDIPLDVQPVLLRVLEERKMMRLGGSRYIPVECNIISATNKNLYDMVQKKEFRDDLYFRLTQFKVYIPALRERGEDILLLSQYFISLFNYKDRTKIPKLDTEAMNALMNYPWPGNIRQLKNVLFQAIVKCKDGIIRKDDLRLEAIVEPPETNSGFHSLNIEEFEKYAIRKALNLTNNNVSEVAQLLGMSKTTLYRKMNMYGITKNFSMKG